MRAKILLVSLLILAVLVGSGCVDNDYIDEEEISGLENVCKFISRYNKSGVEIKNTDDFIGATKESEFYPETITTGYFLEYHHGEGLVIGRVGTSIYKFRSSEKLNEKYNEILETKLSTWLYYEQLNSSITLNSECTFNGVKGWCTYEEWLGSDGYSVDKFYSTRFVWKENGMIKEIGAIFKLDAGFRYENKKELENILNIFVEMLADCQAPDYFSNETKNYCTFSDFEELKFKSKESLSRAYEQLCFFDKDCYPMYFPSIADYWGCCSVAEDFGTYYPYNAAIFEMEGSFMMYESYPRFNYTGILNDNYIITLYDYLRITKFNSTEEAKKIFGWYEKNNKKINLFGINGVYKHWSFSSKSGFSNGVNLYFIWNHGSYIKQITLIIQGPSLEATNHEEMFEVHNKFNPKYFEYGMTQVFPKQLSDCIIVDMLEES